VSEHRYRIAFSLTTLLYAMALALYLYSTSSLVPPDKVPQKETMHLALSHFVSPHSSPLPLSNARPNTTKATPVNKVDKTPTATKKRETVIATKKPLVTPAPISHPLPLLQKKHPPKKKVKKPHTPLHKITSKKHKKHRPHKVKKTPPISKKRSLRRRIKSTHKVASTHRHTKKTHVTKVAKRGASTTASAPASKAQKKAFLAGIKAKINRAKHYPLIAKRRHIQGSVTAHFTILPNGRVGAISLSGASLFFHATRTAIIHAFPINAHTAPLTLPCTLSLTLHYRLE